MRQKISLDSDWRFHLGHAADPSLDFHFGGTTGFATFAKAGIATTTDSLPSPWMKNFPDVEWPTINLPHDWAVELPFRNDPALANTGYKTIGRTDPATSIGWYRKTFTLSPQDLTHRTTLAFDGIFRDAQLWLNGYYLGRNESGYIGFHHDVTDIIAPTNVLTVRVDASQNEGWWYEGAGIYRHVWLIHTHPVHIPLQGTFVTSAMNGATAALTIRTALANHSNTPHTLTLHSEILAPNGTVIATAKTETTLAPWEEKELLHATSIANPQLWDLDTPHLHTLRSTITSQEKTLDQTLTPFGIRTIRLDPNLGLFLNHRPIKIQGLCCHQDHAGVGVALPDQLITWRIEQLKALGANAYRAAHHPPTPELLDACDRLGLLVLDEHRLTGSSTESLSQLERLILRDRNHPSVFLWSMGNEEMQIHGHDHGARVVQTMIRHTKKLDPSRPCTQAMNGWFGKGISHVVDVMGWNYYRLGQIIKTEIDMDQFHQQFPHLPMLATEDGGFLFTRGQYADDPAAGFVNAYGTTLMPWGAEATDAWSYIIARPFLAGAFLWTGFDYRGEPSPHQWPAVISNFGLMDLCGFPKDLYYYFQACWKKAPLVHLLPHWHWPGKEGTPITVWCFANTPQVELLLNGHSLGKKNMPQFGRLEWIIPFTPGTLEARGFNGPTLLTTHTLHTPGTPTTIHAIPTHTHFRANNRDISIINISITDAQNHPIPTANFPLTIILSEDTVRLLGTGNGNPSSHESETAPLRITFNGLAQLILQSTTTPGPIRLALTSPGLNPSDLTLHSA